MKQPCIQLTPPFQERIYNTGDHTLISKEPVLTNIKFKIYKFNNRPRPKNPDNTIFLTMWNEFGSETVGIVYCIPKLLQTKYQGKYSIALGWAGREYLYRHLVDEFWEITDEYQFLREYCRAFHHSSRNLKKLDKKLDGHVVPISELGNIAVLDLFSNVKAAKKTAVWVPTPKIDVSKYIKPNSVAICARKRMTYGRNLQPEFYKNLIYLLESKGYNPIWLGEKVSTMPCPVDHILDFSRMEESKDLETTLAIVAKLKFTIQFYTASTRLAGLVGTPFIIFESPTSLSGGQEGFRLELCSKGDYKIVISHFWSLFNDNKAGLDLVKRSITEIENNNFDTIVGQVENKLAVESLVKEKNI